MKFITVKKVCLVVVCMFMLNVLLMVPVSASEFSTTKGGYDEIKMIDPGQKALDFTIKDLEDEDFQLSDVLGKKVVFLLFWSIFCQPCQEEIPVIVEMQEKIGKENMAILAVSLDGDRRVPSIETFIEKNKLDFTFLMDVFDDEQEGYIASDMYGVLGTPTLYIIDKAGIVRYHHTGKSTLDDLMKHVTAASK